MGSVDGLPLAISFSGLRYHGGTPPLAPQGVTPSLEAVRIVIIMYPNRNFYDGVSKYPLCSFSNGKPLYIPCEVLNTGYVFIYIFWLILCCCKSMDLQLWRKWVFRSILTSSEKRLPTQMMMGTRFILVLGSMLVLLQDIVQNIRVRLYFLINMN